MSEKKKEWNLLLYFWKKTKKTYKNVCSFLLISITKTKSLILMLDLSKTQLKIYKTDCSGEGLKYVDSQKPIKMWPQTNTNNCVSSQKEKENVT